MAVWEWTKAKRMELKDLINRGLTATECAAIMGTTKGAVAGQAYRLQMSFGGGQSPAAKRSKGYAPTDQIAGSGKPWEQRAFNECAAPAGASDGVTLSCCNPRRDEHTAYCAYHHERFHMRGV